MNREDYLEKLRELQGEVSAGRMDDEEYKRLRGELAQSRFGPKADLGQFNELLGKLEGSKMKQQRQRSVEGRRDIFAGGLANMMSNF